MTTGRVDTGPETVPQRIREVGRMLPARLSNEDKTEGFVLVGDDVVRDAVFSAEDDGRIRSRQLRIGSRPMAGVGLRGRAALATVMDHVEPQAAAIMRRPGAPRKAALVINQAPCDDPDRPLMCEKLLARILPAGSELTIYLSDGSTTRRYKTYIGTGEAIA